MWLWEALDLLVPLTNCNRNPTNYGNQLWPEAKGGGGGGGKSPSRGVKPPVQAMPCEHIRHRFLEGHIRNLPVSMRSHVTCHCLHHSASIGLRFLLRSSVSCARRTA